MSKRSPVHVPWMEQEAWTNGPKNLDIEANEYRREYQHGCGTVGGSGRAAQLKQGGMSMTVTQRAWTDDETMQVVQMRRSGLLYREIDEILGRPTDSSKGRMRTTGWEIVLKREADAVRPMNGSAGDRIASDHAGHGWDIVLERRRTGSDGFISYRIFSGHAA